MDTSEHSGYSSVVLLACTRLLNVIAKSKGLSCLAGNIGNASLNACTEEKIYIVCSLKFSPELQGRIAIARKGL